MWRYKDFRSHGPFAQKRALITMMMRKVHQAASGQQELYESALQKLAEFKRLGYPPGLLRGVCGYMAATTVADRQRRMDPGEERLVSSLPKFSLRDPQAERYVPADAGLWH